MNLNTPFNREQESMNIFRDYIHFCHAEQSSLNNILHTQNTSVSYTHLRAHET